MLDFIDKQIEKGFCKSKVGHSDPVGNPTAYGTKLL
jgi:hypothetical protein